MQELVRASFQVILRRFPTQSFLKKVSLRDALIVYAVLVIIAAIESLFLPPLDSTETGAASIGIPLGVSIDIFAIISATLITTWVINRYAKTRLSLKEGFVLQILFTAGARVFFAAATIAGSVFGTGLEFIFGIATFVFALYMLLTMQVGISSIVSITKSQAAYAILAPIAIIIAIWLLFLGIIGGVAATM